MMPDAIAVQVGKSVTDKLLAAVAVGAFDHDFTPERSYLDWELPLDDEGCIHVDICTSAVKQKEELDTRESVAYEIPVAICIRKKFGPEDRVDATGRIKIDKIDSLMLLTEQVYNLFTKLRLEDFDSAVWMSVEILTAPHLKHLYTLSQFTGIVRITFGVDDAL